MERSQGFPVKAQVSTVHPYSKLASGLRDPGGVPRTSPTLLVSKNTKPLRVSPGTEGMTQGDPKCPHKPVHFTKIPILEKRSLCNQVLPPYLWSS